MVISRSITRNLRSTVFSLHRQELMAVTTLLPVYKQWGIISNNKAAFPIAFTAFCSSATLFSRGSGAGTWYGENAYVTLTGISCVTPDYVLNGTYIAIGA